MKIITLLFLDIVATLWKAFVGIKLWEWFIVPNFSAQDLTLPQMVGIMCLFSLLTHQYIPKSSKQIYSSVFIDFLSPLILLLIGWVFS